MWNQVTYSRARRDEFTSLSRVRGVGGVGRSTHPRYDAPRISFGKGTQ